MSQKKMYKTWIILDKYTKQQVNTCTFWVLLSTCLLANDEVDSVRSEFESQRALWSIYADLLKASVD